MISYGYSNGFETWGGFVICGDLRIWTGLTMNIKRFRLTISRLQEVHIVRKPA